MKKRNIIKPTGLKGKEVINRMKELMSSTSINEDVRGSVVELTKEGPDGKVYAIVRENHEYYIKVSENKENLVTEDFNYIGGLQNKKDKVYPSYAKAIKQLNLKFMSLNEAIGKSGQVNVFEDDNLITEHHPLKADMKLSADKGIGDGAEYVVDKKGAELKYDSKEGKEDDGFGDNVADSTAEKDVEEVKLNENETAIDEMIAGEDKSIKILGLDGEGGVEYSYYPYDETNYLGYEEFVAKYPEVMKSYTAKDGEQAIYESRKGFSISRAIQEMDEVIDSIVTVDDKVYEILESLGENERAIMMEALKKKIKE